MNFIRSVFQSFVGLEPQLQHPPPTEPPLLPDPDFNFSPIDEIEFNLSPPMPSPEPAPRPKQRSMKARSQPSAHRRQTRPASPDEPIDDLAVGRIFDSKEDAKEAIHTAILKAGQSWRVARGKNDAYAVKCFSNKDKNDNLFDCKFRVHVTRTNHDNWEIRISRPHTCPSQAHRGFTRGKQAVKNVLPRHLEIIAAEPSTKPKSIQTRERLQQGNQLSYMQSWRIKQKALKTSQGNTASQSELILPFLTYITETQNGGAFARFDVDNIDGTHFFNHCMVFPNAAREKFWVHGPTLISVDGGRMYDNNSSLFVMTSLDGESQIIPLAFGIFPQENKENWKKFLSFILTAGYDIVQRPGEPFLDNGPFPLSIISDRQKGLLPAIDELSIVDFTIKHYYCTQHLASNVKEKFGTAIEKLFRRACQVSTKQEFNKILRDIRQIKQSAFDYISAIPAENYAFYTQTSEYPRYGHSCSNISESAMSFFYEARKKPILLAIEYIWHYIMNIFAKRREINQLFSNLTKFAQYYYNEQLKQAGHYQCQPQNAQQALVKRFESTQTEGRIVDLSNNTCTCRKWQDYHIPCRHAIRVIQHFNKGDPKDLINKRWSVEAYRETYELSLRPVLLHELEPDSKTKPMPQQREKKSGRPKIKRIKANTAHSRAFKYARRQRHYVNPSMSEHQLTNEEPSEYETSNYSDNEEIETSSRPSLNSILRRPQSHPLSSSPLVFSSPQLPQSKRRRQELSEHEMSNNEDTETSLLPSLNSILRRPQSSSPSPSPLASPPPQLSRSKRRRQEPEPEPSQPPRKTRRNVKSKYARCKVCGSDQHQEGRLCPVPHCSHCFSQDHGSFDCKEPRTKGRPSLITGRS